MHKIVTIRQKINKWAQGAKNTSERERIPKYERPGKSTVEVLTKAQNVYLHNVEMPVAGRDINITNNNINHQHSCTDLELHEALRRIGDPNNCSWDPARTCLQGTRQRHIEEIRSWISSRTEGSSSAELLIIADSVGSGKSALAHTLCQQTQSQGVLVVGFFFNQMELQSTPSNLMAALLRGLCDISDKVKRGIGEILVKDSTLASAKPIRQFESIILPICPLLPSGKTFVAIIDALDEEQDAVILDILRSWVPRLPHSFRIIATTRPEPRIMKHFDNQPHIRRFILSLTGESNHQDIQVFITSRLLNASFGQSITPKLLGEFVSKTEGLFLWGETVLAHLEDSFDAVAELEDIVRGKSTHWEEDDEATKKLETLYLRILSKLKWTDSRFVEKYRVIMGALVTLKEPLSATAIAAMYATERVTVTDIDRLCSLLQPLLQNYTKQNSNQPLRLLHLSVRDFLTKRAPDLYRLDNKAHDAKLSRLALGIIKQELTTVNVPLLGYSAGDWICDPIREPPQIPLLVKDGISEHLGYACRFVGEHTSAIPEDYTQEVDVQLMRDILVVDPRPVLEVTASMGAVIQIVPLRKQTLASYPFLQMSGRLLDDGANIATAELYLAIGRCLDIAERYSEAVPIIEDATKLYRQIHSHQVDPTTRTRAQFSISLFVLATSLIGLKRHDEALPSIEESVVLARQLCSPNVELYQPLLARVLRTHGVILGNLKRHEEAYQTGLEDLELFRRLVTTDQDQYESHLAWALHHIAWYANGSARKHEAVLFASEAVEIRRRIVSKAPSEEANLAASLHEYAIYLAECDRAEESIGPGQEAVVIRRRLASVDPDQYEAGLSDSLHNLACDMETCKRPADSLPYFEEAVSIRRRLADKNPKTLSSLSYSLHSYANAFSEAGRHKDALEPGRAAVDIRRQLVAEDPGKYEQHLAWSLAKLAWYYSSSKLLPDAVPSSEEATRLFRALTAVNSEKWEPELATSLHNQAFYLVNAGKISNSLSLGQEAISIRRRLAERNPDEFEQWLASTLHNYAYHCSLLDKLTDAIAYTKEAVDIRRHLAAKNPSEFELDFSSSLHNYAIYLAGSGQTEESIQPGQEAVSIRRRLASADPDSIRPMLGQSLYNLAFDLGTCGRHEEGLPLVQESVEVRRRLVEKDPDAYSEDLASSLETYARRLSDCGRVVDSVEYAQEAAAIRRSLLQAGNPTASVTGLSETLSNMAIDLNACGRHEEAILASGEAIGLRQKEPQQDFGESVANAMHNHALFLSSAGRMNEAIDFMQQTLPIRRQLVSQAQCREKLGTPSLSTTNLSQSHPVSRDVDDQSLLQSARFEADLARSLHAYALYLANCNRQAEAVKAGEEATAIRRKLGDEGLLTSTLHNLVVDIVFCRRYADAIPVAEELVALRRRQVARDPTVYEPDLAALLRNLAGYLTRNNRHNDALIPSQESVAIYTRLVEQDPVKFEPQLALSLNAYAWYLCHCPGHEADAIEPANQSINILRRLSATDATSPPYHDYLSNSLDTLASVMNRCHRYEEAVALAGEGIEIYKSLLERDPTNDYDYIGSSLFKSYAEALVGVGREEEALTPIQESMAIFRRIDRDPDDERELQDAIILFERLSETTVSVSRDVLHPLLQDYSSNNSQQPFRLLHLSVQEYLTQRAPSPYRLSSEEHEATLSRLALHVLKNELTPTNIPMLGYSGGDWIDEMTTEVPEIPYLLKEAVSEQLWYAGQFVGDHTLSMAIDGLQQSHIHLLRDLVIDSQYILEMTASIGNLIKIGPLRKRTLELLPEAGLDNEVIRRTAKTYLRLANCLKAELRYAEARPIAEDSAALYRQLATSDHNDISFGVEMTLALNVLALSLDPLDRREEGLHIVEEGLDIARRLTAMDLESHRPILASVLHTKSVLLNHLEKHAEALEPAMEVVKLYRVLSTTFREILDAVNAGQKAANIYRRLVQTAPEQFARVFLSTISDLAIDLRVCGQHEEAIRVTEDRIAVLRGVATLMDPTKFEPLLGDALHGHAVCLGMCGRNADALEPGQEALEIRHRLALSDPELFNTDLATTLHNMVCDLNACDRQVDALPYLEELVTVRRQSAEQDPDKHEYPLHGLLYHYANQLAECGRYFAVMEKSKEAVEVARRLANKDAS
ncbi:TPR-like protein [Coprinopsis marcescibilis]|uniref:TPR-like protein n=1 Tax=Coprinopsis marcescibilis TaxID=230819 RepID=A0A5C3LK86_COPMA|nr:TPR-like protein [Coprinopsis marcescibilis]